MADSKETVIIEFIVDNKEVQPSIDLLEKVGMVDKKVADQFRKSNSDYQARVKATKDLSEQNKATGNTMEDLAKKAAKVPDAIGGNAVAKEFSEMKKGAEGVKDAMAETVVEVEKRGQSAKARLRELKNELNNLADAGKEDSAEFKKLSIEAGNLSDQIGDIGAQVKILGSDTKNIDALIETAGAVTGAFFLANQATKALGIENKALEDTMGGVEATIATLNSLQTIGNAIKKNSTANTVILNAVENSSIATKLRASGATAIQNGLESQSVIVKGAATAAQWLLNSAMMANPVLLIVGATAALVGVLALMGDENQDAAKDQERLNTIEEARLKVVEDMRTELQKRHEQEQSLLQFEIQMAEAQGKSRQEVRDLEKKLEQDKLVAAETNKGMAAVEIGRLDENKQKTKLLTAEIANLKAGKDAEDDSVKELITSKEKELELTQKSVDIGIDAYKQLADANREALLNKAKFEKEQRDLSMASNKAFADAQVLLAKQGSQAELSAKINALEVDRSQRLAKENITAGEIALINAQVNKSIYDLKQEYMLKNLSDQKKVIDEQLAIVEKGSKKELDLKIADIKKQNAIDIAQTGVTEQMKGLLKIKAEQDIAALKLAFNQQVLESQLNADISYIHAKLLTAKQGSAEELKLKKDLIDKQAFLDVENAVKSIQNEEERVAKVNEIRTKALVDKQQLDKEQLAKEIELNQSSLTAISTHQKAVQNLVLNDRRATYDQKAQAAVELIDIDIKTAKEQEAILEQKKTAGQVTDADYLAQKQALADQEIKLEQDKENTIAAQQRERIERGFEIAKSFIGAAQEVSKSVLEFEMGRIEKQYGPEEAKLQALIDKKKEQGENTEAIEKRLSQLQKERAKEEADIKRRQAVVDKALAVFQIGIATAEAVIKFLANPGGPAGVALSVAAGITGAAQIAAVVSKPIPAFAVGTKAAPPGFKWVGEQGPELINDAGGYAIMTNKDSMDLLAKYDIPSIHVPAYSFPMIDDDTKRMLAHSPAGTTIDYNKIGEAIGRNIPQQKEESVRIDINEHGFTARLKQNESTMVFMDNKFTYEN